MNKLLTGIGASVGVSVAKAYILVTPEFNTERIAVKNYRYEVEKYFNALTETIVQLKNIRKIAFTKLGEDKATIFDAHVEIADDPLIKEEVINLINDSKVNASYAIEYVYRQHYEKFLMMEDQYFKEKATDILDVKKRLLACVLGVKLPDLLGINENVIVVARDLTPSETALLNKKYVKGFVTDMGSKTSHATIMARSMQIPAVLGLKNITDLVKEDDLIAIDGTNGEVEINPQNSNIWLKRAEKFTIQQQELKKYINIESKTVDSKKILIEANIGNPTDVNISKQYGAEGIGLYRSEFLYMGNDHWPTENEQYEGYKKVLEQLKDQLIIIRTLDIGGDKKLPYFEFHNEMNPFLGCRAIRFCLDRLDIFEVQIRALGRASVHGKLAIMFPMIATISEFLRAKEFTLKIFANLKKEGYKINDNIKIGMMIEVPSSAVLSDKFAEHADFFSIGTNDLIQYTFACDRMSKEVAYLYQPNNPAILRLVKMSIDGGHSKNRLVGMCGEMAGDILSIPLLIGAGIDSLSMSATSIPQARKIVNNVKYSECCNLFEKATKLFSVREVNNLVEEFLKDKKLI